MARGDFQHEVKVTAADELGILGAGFNYAAGRLHHLYEELRDAEEAARHSKSELRDLIENVPANFDVAALRNFRVRERYTIQFRAEAFNLANHVRFANPVLSWERPRLG